MSVDFSGITAERKRLEALIQDMPKIMEKLVVGEGVYAVGQARRICKEDNPDIIDNGTYRMNFHAGNKALAGAGNREYDGSPVKRSGSTYRIDVYNNLDYAKHLEYGFRSHFVPIKYFSSTFVAKYMAKHGLDKPPNGIYVGPYKGFINGHFTLRRALRKTKQSQDARLKRKFDKILNQYLNGKGAGGNEPE